MMFGYADSATEELMPAPIAFSHRLLDELQRIRKTKEIDYSPSINLLMFKGLTSVGPFYV